MNGLKKIFFVALLMFMCGVVEVQAQHTFGVYGGISSASARLFPKREMRQIFPLVNSGVSWRYYSMPRFVGCVGADLEFLQRGYSYGYRYESEFDEDGKEKRHYKFYTRNLNSIMLPIVWQPHVYLARNHVRLYIEGAVTFSYNFGGDYEYEEYPYTGEPSGKYNWRVERDNRWNYGLAGGGGFALLFGRWEFGFRARYYFGYADLMRNLNKYYDNSTDGPENPFWYTPNRSPLDNLTFNLTFAYRFNKEGFETWNYKRERSRQIKNKEFNFSEAGGGNSGRRGGIRRR